MASGLLPTTGPIIITMIEHEQFLKIFPHSGFQHLVVRPGGTLPYLPVSGGKVDEPLPDR